MSSDEVIGLYRRHAQKWIELRGSGKPEQKWLDRFIKLVPKSTSILDMGCGSGDPIGRYLVDKKFEVTGVDASPELIKIARQSDFEADWVDGDMRTLELAKKFEGILAWNSLFHLAPEDQPQMFSVFQHHAKDGAALMFTTGPKAGVSMGEFEGDPLYHASLAANEYVVLLNQNGFDVVDHVIEDPDCNRQTIWLAQFRARAPHK